MLTALASADSVTWLSIIVKALAYAATLGAVGGVLVLAMLRGLTEGGRQALRRSAALSALAAALLSGLRLPLRASFLMGGTWDGAFDPAILALVIQSPLGTSLAVRLVGMALVLLVLRPGRAGLRFALAGACLAAASFALRGHALGDPRALLGPLVTVHILCLSFWVGAFAPLMRAARHDPPAKAGALAEEFGRRALLAVACLVMSGGLVLALLSGATLSALFTPYGQLFLLKLAAFCGVLMLAAANKLVLTPALLAARPDAARRLRRSIGLEALLVGVILVTTATLTTISAPPGTASTAQAELMPQSRPPEARHRGEAT